MENYIPFCKGVIYLNQGYSLTSRQIPFARRESIFAGRATPEGLEILYKNSVLETKVCFLFWAGGGMIDYWSYT
jgi:hypothetical protein